MCVDDNDECNLEETSLIKRTPSNAQNTQHKLEVAFSYLERNHSSLIAFGSDLDSFLCEINNH